MSYNENLKVFAACYVAETDISIDNKVQLIDYIKNSSSKHIEHLLCTGYMKESLTEEEKLLEISSVWKETISYKGAWVQSTSQTGPTAMQGMVAAAAAALVLMLGVKTYKRFFSKAAKACKGTSGQAKTSCMNKAKLAAQKAKITAMQQGISKCAKSKNPAACKMKVQKRINVEKAKLGQL